MDIKALSDTQLAEQFKTVEEKDEALSSRIAKELFTRFYKRAFNIARFYGLRPSDADDAVQNAFIRAFRHIHSYKSANEFSPWFFKIVVNCVKDRYKQMYRHKHADLDDVKEYVSDGENFDDELHKLDILKGIVNGLPDKLRVTAVLRIYGQMSVDEVSDTLKISRRQVYNRLGDAYRIMKDRAEKEGLSL